MPIDYKKYPKNWLSEIRPRILKRAEHRCEFCKLENYAIGYRDKQGKFYLWQEIEDALDNRGYDYFENELSHYVAADGSIKKQLTKIILTIAHLDHDIANNDDNNLKALCQYCHLQYDKGKHQQTRMANKAKRQPTLF